MELNKGIPKYQDISIAPMHTCEHILNRTVMNLFGCGRAVSAHIERKKSKMDFALSSPPCQEDINYIQEKVNEVIAQNHSVYMEYISHEEANGRFDLERLPQGVTDTVRIVKVGNYDECLCIGSHVKNTSEIGHFLISSSNYEKGIFRIRFKLKR